MAMLRSVSGNGHARVFQPRGTSFERGRIGGLPAKKGDTLAAILVDDDALLAIVHPQCDPPVGLVHDLHAEKPGAEARPILERACANADISKRLNVHARPPYRA